MSSVNDTGDLQRQEYRWILPFDAREFARHLRAEDELQAILRGHLYVEHILIEFLRLGLPAFDLLNVEKLNFVTKLDMCAALHFVSPHLVPAIKKLNSIRNKVAHHLDYRFDDTEKRAFIGALPPAWQDIVFRKGKMAGERSVEEVALFDILIAVFAFLDIGLKRYVAWKELREESFEALGGVLQDVGLDGEALATVRSLLERLAEGFRQEPEAE